MVEYSYNSWGKYRHNNSEQPSSLTVVNPFRYRGYIYDEETNLYYLKSRYYWPDRCRFVSADSIIYTGDALLFNSIYEYCNNNPIKNVDNSGTLHAIHAGVGGAGLNRKAQMKGSTLRISGNSYKVRLTDKEKMSRSSSKARIGIGVSKKSFFSLDAALIEFGTIDLDSDYGLLNIIKDCIVTLEVKVVVLDLGMHNKYADVSLVVGKNDTLEDGLANRGAYDNVYLRSEPIRMIKESPHGYYMVNPNNNDIVLVEDTNSWISETIAATEIMWMDL